MFIPCQQSRKLTRRFFTVSVAEGYKYAKSHEWAKIDGDVATVGISDHAQVIHDPDHFLTCQLAELVFSQPISLILHTPHAQSELGDVVYVELPDIGKKVKAGETFGVVESVKVRDLHGLRLGPED